MKYKDMNLTKEELQNKGLLQGIKFKKCFVCKEDTNYIDFCGEVRICSEECMEEFNTLVMMAEL